MNRHQRVRWIVLNRVLITRTIIQYMELVIIHNTVPSIRMVPVVPFIPYRHRSVISNEHDPIQVRPIPLDSPNRFVIRHWSQLEWQRRVQPVVDANRMIVNRPAHHYVPVLVQVAVRSLIRSGKQKTMSSFHICHQSIYSHTHTHTHTYQTHLKTYFNIHSSLRGSAWMTYHFDCLSTSATRWQDPFSPSTIIVKVYIYKQIDIHSASLYTKEIVFAKMIIC